MPTYDYKCKKCENKFELFSIQDESTVTCPVFGTVADIVIGKGSGVIFKGSGFYLTDYKNKHVVS